MKCNRKELKTKAKSKLLKKTALYRTKKKKNPFKLSRKRKIPAEMEDLSTKVHKAPFIGTTLAKQVAEIVKISKH